MESGQGYDCSSLTVASSVPSKVCGASGHAGALALEGTPARPCTLHSLEGMLAGSPCSCGLVMSAKLPQISPRAKLLCIHGTNFLVKNSPQFYS